MRILIAHNLYRSAEPSGENGVVDLEQALLRDAGHDVSLLQVHSDAIADWNLLRRAALPARVVWSHSGARQVRDAIRRDQPDVIHFHNTFPLLSPAAIRAAHAENIATVQTFHNFRPICPSSTGLLRAGIICTECLGRLPLPAIRHGCYRGSRLATIPLAIMDATHNHLGTWTHMLDRLIFPSEFARARYLESGWPAERTVVKYNTAPRPITTTAPKRTGFCSIARMRPEKGIDLLLTAWETGVPKAQVLTLVGGGDDLRAYEADAANLTNVRFLGQQKADAIPNIIAGSNAVIVASRVPEVFPRVVVEAYALATPVIAARRGVLSDLVEEGVTGLLFEPESAGDLVRVINQALASPATLRKLGDGARRAYESHYSPEAITANLVEIYDQAVDARAARAFASPTRR